MLIILAPPRSPRKKRDEQDYTADDTDAECKEKKDEHYIWTDRHVLTPYSFHAGQPHVRQPARKPNRYTSRGTLSRTPSERHPLPR